MAARLLVVSNGHGEDAIGAALASELRDHRAGLDIQAFPVVGEGHAYRSAGFTTVGPTRSLPSAGLTLHSRENLMADLKAGLMTLTAHQLWSLTRTRTDILLVVGDLFAQVLTGATRSRARFVVQPLVSIRQADGAPPPLHRRAMERFTYPERALLRHLATRVYVRDAPTAAWLCSHGVPQAVALGNPAMDAVRPRRAPGAQDGPVVAAEPRDLALLPGSRGHADRSLAVMLQVVELGSWSAAVAWARPRPPMAPGWSWTPSEGTGSALLGWLDRRGTQVPVYDRELAVVLAGVRAALGTTGTATEQAASAGVPVASFPVPPEHTSDFLAAQKRLLGDALQVTAPDPVRVHAALQRWFEDDARHAAAARAGRERMGGPGGTAAIARDLLQASASLGLL